MSNTESEKTGQAKYEITIDGDVVGLVFTPGNLSPFQKTKTGSVALSKNGILAGEYPYTETSYVPLPNPFFPK